MIQDTIRVESQPRGWEISFTQQAAVDRTNYALENGQQLTVSRLEPPLGDWADRVEYGWRDVRSPLLTGEFADTSLDFFFVGEIDGAYVGSMTYATPRDTRDVAVLGMVWTHPEQRRKGISTVLLKHALGVFRAQGGMAMYLCTTNPHAFALYSKAGFRPLVGDGMRYLAPGHEDFDHTYFADAGPAQVRSATWGDLARVSALYNQPDPDWLIKDYHSPRRVFKDMRYESHYIRVWRPARQNRGVALVLENPRRRVVGFAASVAVDSYYEQHIHSLDFWACPAYLPQVPALLAGVIERAGAQGAEVIEAHVEAGNREKQRLLEAAGFQEEARLRDRLRVANERVDLQIYSRFLDRKDVPVHPLDSYYGARRDFHRAT